MIRAHDLTKSYGASSTAVDAISFKVAEGEIFAFLGPNGAGKTTTVKMLTTLLKPSSGLVELDGLDPAAHQNEVRKRFGIVFQDSSTDDELTAYENMDIHGVFYHVPRRLRAQRIPRLLRLFELWERRDDPVKRFSGGMRRRLEIARGLMHSPRVLFLDEPTIGLDPQTRRSIWTYIRELQEREQITIFMTTHYMDEAEWCDRIAIMDHGQIVALDAPETLKAQVGTDRVSIHTDDDDATIAALKERFDVEAWISEGAVTFAVPQGEEFVPRLFAELGIPIKAVHVSRPTLDDVFMSYTGSTIRDAEEDQGKDRNRRMMQMMHGGGRR